MKTIINIEPGAQLDESSDFAVMLRSMYIGWCNRKSYNIIDDGVSLVIEGEDLTRLTQEHGVHRLVRISPHDPQKRRHTSFCKVSIAGQPPVQWERAIRSYIFSPYKRAINIITRKETQNVEEVLAGNLELLD
jgi:protein subunit release factor B